MSDIEVVDSIPEESALVKDVSAAPEADDVTQEASPDITEEAQDVEPEPETKKHDAQSRIRQLANEKALLRQENQELQDLLRQRQAERTQQQAATVGDKPKPDDYVGGVFNPDYIEALTDYKMVQAIERREHERTEQQKKSEGHLF